MARRSWQQDLSRFESVVKKSVVELQGADKTCSTCSSRALDSCTRRKRSALWRGLPESVLDAKTSRQTHRVCIGTRGRGSGKRTLCAQGSMAVSSSLRRRTCGDLNSRARSRSIWCEAHKPNELRILEMLEAPRVPCECCERVDRATSQLTREVLVAIEAFEPLHDPTTRARTEVNAARIARQPASAPCKSLKLSPCQVRCRQLLHDGPRSQPGEHSAARASVSQTTAICESVRLHVCLARKTVLPVARRR